MPARTKSRYARRAPGVRPCSESRLASPATAAAPYSAWDRIRLTQSAGTVLSASVDSSQVPARRGAGQPRQLGQRQVCATRPGLRDVAGPVGHDDTALPEHPFRDPGRAVGAPVRDHDHGGRQHGCLQCTDHRRDAGGDPPVLVTGRDDHGQRRGRTPHLAAWKNGSRDPWNSATTGCGNTGS